MDASTHPQGTGGDGHRIRLEESDRHVRVERDGQVLAESRRPLLLHETGLPVRYYLPPDDVRLELLVPSASHTVCPFKGTASYWSLPGGPADVAWAYPEPLPDVAAIKDRLCFYDTQVVTD
ncbi:MULTISPECIES: DUF427 domain-containing protein [Streptomyces]|uniref:DUF427 domain-containing protein n=1 Tax=Streptomyces TaxID=1883 RepID=UPI0022499FF8|nr:DUF427 domain-containing protein [Streptomyces sp. JHD 1]MCX2970059.1 DUF427 domain-containing protein [Streptomyces sp. JHD 1]